MRPAPITASPQFFQRSPEPKKCTSNPNEQKCWGILSYVKGNDLAADGCADICAEDNAESLREGEDAGMDHRDRHDDDDGGRIERRRSHSARQ